MAFREVSVIEVREVLRAWLDGAGYPARRREQGGRGPQDGPPLRGGGAGGGAATAAAGFDAVDDGLIGQVVDAVRPARPNGHGAAWERCGGRGSRSPRGWRRGCGAAVDGRQDRRRCWPGRACAVPYRTLHRFAT